MTETTTEEPKVRETAADRRALPNLYEVAVAAAEKFGVCVRPVTMRVEDPKTGTVSYVGSPCKATIESVCKPCADKARYLRITQCREGWHAETEPVAETREPTEWQTELLTARADLVVQYLEAKDDGDEDLMAAIREIVTDLDQELRACGLRGPLPSLDPKPARRRARSTKRRQDVPDLPRKKVARNTIGRVYGGKYRPSMMVTLTMPSYGAINPMARSTRRPACRARMVPRVAPTSTTIPVPHEISCSAPRCSTGGSRTCVARSATTCSTSRPWNRRNVVPRTFMCCCGPRSRATS
jgi:hypothetical protein